jgi:PAS domain S-box-containing protein
MQNPTLDRKTIMSYPFTSQLKFNQLIDQLNDLVVAIDLDGCFVYINKAVIKVLGYEPEEMIGHSYLDFVVENDHSKSIQAVDNFIRGQETPNFFNYYYKKDGSILPIAWSGQWDAKDRLMFCLGRDISETVQSESLQAKYEEKLKMHNQQMVGILERITDGFFALDLEHRIIYWNKRAEEILGKTREEVLSRQIWECYPDMRETTFYTEIKNAAKSGQIANFEEWVSSWKQWFETTIVPSSSGISVFFRDISSKKKAEEELRLLSLIVKETDNSIILTDLEGRITWVNEAFTKTTGYSFDEVVGQLPGPLLDCQEKDREVKRFLDERVQKRESFQLEIQNRKKDGGTFWWEVHYQPLHDNEGNIQQFFSMNTDITERKLLQQHLDQERELFRKRLTAAAVEASEAERAHVGQELHDNVNQVLTTVKLYLELMAAGDEQNKELLEKSAQLLQTSITDIRSLSKRLSAPTLGDISIKETLSELVDSIAITKAIKFTLNTACFDWLEMPKELHLALYRIAQEQLTNIIKHSNARNVRITLMQTAETIVLEISDDGVGAPPKGAKTKGIGIANMISRAEMFNGKIEIESAPEQGFVLRAVFPANKKLDSDV